MSIRPIKLPLTLDDHEPTSLPEDHASDWRNVRSTRDRLERGPGLVLASPAPIPGDNPGASFIIGEFTIPAATGSQTVYHGLGVIPKAGIVWSSGAHATDVPVNSAHFSVGFVSVGHSERSVGTAIGPGVSPSQAYSRFDQVLIVGINPAGVVIASGTGTSWDDHSFTINWTVVDPTAAGVVVGYILGGATVLQAALVEWALPTSPGAKAVTGVGFVPQVVIHLGSKLTTHASDVNAQFVLGCMQVGGTQWTQTFGSQNGVTPSNCGTYGDTASCLAMLQAPSTINYKASFTSMDADGFTVNVTTAPASAYLIASLCLAGLPSVGVNAFDPVATSPPVRQTVAFPLTGFPPVGIIFVRSNSAPATPTTGIDYTLGVAMLAGGHGISIAELSGVTPTLPGSLAFQDAGIVAMDPSTLSETLKGQYVEAIDDGGVINWVFGNDTAPGQHPVFFLAIGTDGSSTGIVGLPRTYAQVWVGVVAPEEQIVMLTSTSAYVYNVGDIDPVTGLPRLDPTGEVYTGGPDPRFSVVNTTGTSGAIAAWSQGVDNIRQWDGLSFSNLVKVGTNIAARVLLAFNNRVIAIRPFFGGVDHITQIRWPANGDPNDWSGVGSGALEVVESSNAPLVSGVVLGGRCFVMREKELIEVVATGSLTPVFETVTRIPGMGCLAAYSVAAGEYFAFWLGPDDVFQWDGSTLTAVGGDIYNTLIQLIDYEAPDTICGVVNTVDSEYWLLLSTGDVFIYDYRRDRWYRDTYANIVAMGVILVGGLISGEVRSQRIIFGTTDGRTLRTSYTDRRFLGAPVDSYVVTKDYTAEQLLKTGNARIDLWDLNSLREFRFQGLPGSVMEVGASVDLGSTWVTQSITVNSNGVGVAFFQLPFSQIRFRLRCFTASTYEVRAGLGFDFEATGYQFP